MENMNEKIFVYCFHCTAIVATVCVASRSVSTVRLRRMYNAKETTALPMAMLLANQRGAQWQYCLALDSIVLQVPSATSSHHTITLPLHATLYSTSRPGCCTSGCIASTLKGASHDMVRYIVKMPCASSAVSNLSAFLYTSPVP